MDVYPAAFVDPIQIAGFINELGWEPENALEEFRCGSGKQ